MNFSHGSYDYHQSVIDNTRKMVACEYAEFHGASADGFLQPSLGVRWPLLLTRLVFRPLSAAQNSCVVSERTRDPYGSYEGWKGRASLSFTIVFPGLTLETLQIPIKAGHEFTITTDDKFSECCDDKLLWLDYVCDMSWGQEYSN